MSLDTTATNEENISREAEAANRFVSLYQNKGYADALAFHSSLEPNLKDYVKYSQLSERLYKEAREQLESNLKC